MSVLVVARQETRILATQQSFIAPVRTKARGHGT